MFNENNILLKIVNIRFLFIILVCYNYYLIIEEEYFYTLSFIIFIIEIRIIQR